MPSRDDVRRLAKASMGRGDPTGWFDELYQSVDGSWSSIPWVHLAPNPLLVEWLASWPSRFSVNHNSGLTCLVVGCGLGDDAEALAAMGFDVTAFDVSPTAVAGCLARFPDSKVEYVVADALKLTKRWTGRFDLVFEANTLQVIPSNLRPSAMRGVADTVALDGRLLVMCRARETSEPEGELPWPLTRDELGEFCRCGLTEIEIECDLDEEVPPVRRFRALYGRLTRLA